ncbi:MULTISPECIES: pyruvate dehydrogenase complex E1 component subunit beta [unclassified Streptomyces]|uniref:alpha-ketoacid dehydrogenase subunit alpha/beta n=1 Tax=unclassified Streptomyces TaxID=2593676 RepID=UPI00190C4064|nr:MULTISPECIES: dehydrogenase E1 component subunit alpha/beta [unclassified Streptomyces]MBK3565437.1 dehydrogenase E1 component subunit alpha/beta [Streptomyces sp. MBT62]MBK6011387.1 dehydrogenase E1 component subunit alpha/beta [Streptomyces sp. MBT53]
MTQASHHIGTATGTARTDQLLEMYRRMRRIRRFEERASDLYKATEIPGFLHLSIGQEASAVGACWPLGARDGITSTHRGHGHVLAKGLDSASMMAELMGKDAGTCHGRGGSMHIADPGLGIYGANGIVGAGLPIAAGVATAAKLRAAGDVVVAFFGDGAVAQGMFHEAVNLAAVWDLPVVFLCENNHYSEFSPESEQHRAPLSARAAGYGIEYQHVDGNDVLAVAQTMTGLVARLRAGGGPVLLEAETYRWHGHYEGDPERYRPAEEVAAAKERDPLLIARRQLDSAAADAVDEEIDKEIEAAIDWARSLPEPAPETLHDYVSAPRLPIPEPAPLPADAEIFRSMDAVRLALEHELTADPSVFVAGIDVGAGGNVFGLTRGLAQAFPGRVRDTPISESAIVGTAVGAAMAGMKPVVEIMYMDFIGVCLDMLLNQAAKLRFMTGGRASMPLVVRTQFGAGRSSGSQHSQSLEAILAHIPGLTVVMPSNPADTYGLLRAAIQDPNPVVFVENRLQYGLKGPKPPADHLIPLGKAKVIREGTDITLVSWSRMVQDALAAAELLAGEGISVEVIDLRTIAPLDRETVLASLAKTNRLVIAHEAVRDFGVGAELSAMAVDEGFWHLDAPVTRVAPPSVPAPYAPSLEHVWLPSRDTIADTVRRIAAV